jgi:hypothetical protein
VELLLLCLRRAGGWEWRSFRDGLAVAAGGAVKASKTTVLMTGTEGMGAMKKADVVVKTYKPAR